MSNTIEFVEKNKCCGCEACVQRCPKKAIQFKENNEGFYYPIIDEGKCIKCGLCSKVCPQLEQSAKQSETKFPKAYAVQNKDEKVIMKSTSGGMFSLLAEYVFKNHGVVAGAAYDENFNVHHIIAKNKVDLEKIRGSKYVQSRINDVFIKVESELKKGTLVLFSGTPCQIAGLKKYLMVNYDNLILCDIVCHGVPSNKLFRKYIEYLNSKFKSKVVQYDFRNKEKKGWGLISKVITDNNKVYYIEPEFDPYYYHFLAGDIYRESCYKCKYANYKRESDITMGDYWGVIKIHPELFGEKGCSLVLVNSTKGEKLIQKISNNAEVIETDLEFASIINKNLKKPTSRSDMRNNIYDDIDEQNYIKEHLSVSLSLRAIIKMLTPSFLKKIRNKIRKNIELRKKVKN